MRKITVATVVLGLVMSASLHAEAGNKNASFDLIGWSTDSKSVLLTRRRIEDNKLGTTFSYVFITANDPKPLEIITHDNLADDDIADKIDIKTCNQAADALTKALAAKRFKGLTANKKECTDRSDRLLIVTTGNAVGKVNTASWLVTVDGSKAHTPPTKSEAIALADKATLQEDNAVIATNSDASLVLVIFGGSLAYFNKDKLVAKDL